jgi:hypothetical protein
VEGGGLPGRRRVGRDQHLLDPAGLDPAHELGDPQVVGVDSVDRRERAAEDVVQAAVLVGPLDRDHVGGLLDDADQALVA